MCFPVDKPKTMLVTVTLALAALKELLPSSFELMKD